MYGIGFTISNSSFAPLMHMTVVVNMVILMKGVQKGFGHIL